MRVLIEPGNEWLDFSPRRLRGPWNDGFALDVHTRSSKFMGYDRDGRLKFSTQRSPVGELLFRLKYRQDFSVVGPLAGASACILDQWHWPLDAIVPVPPSVERARQPVIQVATALAKRIKIPVCPTWVEKVKKTPQMKDVVEYDIRRDALEGAFKVDEPHTRSKTLLVFDDLYGSGATVAAIARLLRADGHAKALYLLTLTKRK